MICKSAIGAFTKAEIARLKERVSFRVYGKAEKNPVYPYCVISEGTETPSPTKHIGKTDNTNVIHLFSKRDSIEELVEMVDAVCNAFDTPLDMAVDGFSEVECIPRQRRYDQLYDEGQNILQHGEIDIEAIIQQL